MVRVLVALWAGLAVQGPDSTVRARSGAALRAVNDSLSAVEAAAGQFQMDLTNASPDLVVSRAHRLTARCAGARLAAARLDTLLAPGTPLRGDLAALRAELARCEASFTPSRSHPADSIKAWGPYRLAALGDTVRRYRIAAQSFMTRAHIK